MQSNANMDTGYDYEHDDASFELGRLMQVDYGYTKLDDQRYVITLYPVDECEQVMQEALHRWKARIQECLKLAWMNDNLRAVVASTTHDGSPCLEVLYVTDPRVGDLDANIQASLDELRTPIF